MVYSVSAEYSVRYSAEYFGRNRFRSDSTVWECYCHALEQIRLISVCCASCFFSSALCAFLTQWELVQGMLLLFLSLLLVLHINPIPNPSQSFVRSRKFELCLEGLGEFLKFCQSLYRGYRILWQSACDTFVCMFHQFPSLCFELEKKWDHIYNIIVY